MITKNNKFYMYVHAIIAFIFLVVCFFISMIISNEHRPYTYLARLVFQYTVLYGIPFILAIVWTFKNLRITDKGYEDGVIDLKYSTYILIWGIVTFLLTLIPADDDYIFISKLFFQNGYLCSYSIFFTIPLAVFASALTYRHQACEADIIEVVSKVKKNLLVIGVFVLIFLIVSLITNSFKGDVNVIVIASLLSGIIYMLPVIFVLSMIGKSYSSGTVSLEKDKDEKTALKNYFGIQIHKDIYSRICGVGFLLWAILISSASIFVKESRYEMYRMWNTESIVMPIVLIALPLAVFWYFMMPEKAKECITDTCGQGDIANEQEQENKYSFVDFLKKNVVIILICSLISLLLLNVLGLAIVFGVAFMLYKKKINNSEGSSQEQ